MIGQLTADEILKFWEDPKNSDLIINSIPIECLQLSNFT